MKKYFSLAAGVLLLAGSAIGMSLPALAQTGAASGPFADVPADHWAYGAVNTLQKAGIVIGYPDGTYGGRRAMTRYEFAVAIARLLPMIQQPIDTSQFVKNSDFQAFQTDVNGRIQQQQQDIDALKALVNEFQPELEKLGQDVDAIKARLDADEQRLAVVEAEQRRVKITGEVNAISESAVNSDSNDDRPIDQNGTKVGSNTDTSILDDINVYEDVLLTIDGRVSDSDHAIVKLDAGNYLPHLGNATEPSTLGADGGGGGTQDAFSVYEAYLDMPVDLGAFSSAEAVVGRFGEQFTPFTLKAVNPDIYTSLPETSTGDYVMDGGKLNFSAGPAHVQLYAAQLNNTDAGPGAHYGMAGGPTVASAGPFRPGSFDIGSAGDTNNLGVEDNQMDQSAGARITYGDPNNWVIGVSGLVAGFNTGALQDPYVHPYSLASNVPGGPGPIGGFSSAFQDYNTIAVYGVDFHGTLPFVKSQGLTLDGEFANSGTGTGTNLGNVNATHGTEAYRAELGYTFGPLNIKGGYEDIYANFAAPGNWGQIGEYINPTNVEGGIAHASYAVTPTLSLDADGNFLKGQYNTGIQNPLGSSDDLTSFDVGVKYGLTSQYALDLGYEWVQWNLKNDQGFLPGSPADPSGAGKPTEQYITIGVGHSFTQNASLKLMYQILDYDGDNTGFDPNGNSEHGGIAVTQLSVKF